MNPGKLDRRIVIQVRTMTRDNTGTRVETWADHATVWAEYVRHKAGAAVIADTDRTQDDQQFRIRTRAINPTDHRILYKSKFYDIKGVSEVGRGDFLLIDAVATQSIS